MDTLDALDSLVVDTVAGLDSLVAGIAVVVDIVMMVVEDTHCTDLLEGDHHCIDHHMAVGDIVMMMVVDIAVVEGKHHIGASLVVEEDTY